MGATEVGRLAASGSPTPREGVALVEIIRADCPAVPGSSEPREDPEPPCAEEARPGSDDPAPPRPSESGEGLQCPHVEEARPGLDAPAPPVPSDMWEGPKRPHAEAAQPGSGDPVLKRARKVSLR